MSTSLNTPADHLTVDWIEDASLSGTPRILGQYELLRKIGSGGMGSVYKARHQHLRNIVAIKVLPPEKMAKPDAISRFENEIQAIGCLEHPNIVRATDAQEIDGLHFLVMEFVKGPDLQSLVKHHGPLDANTACELIRQAAAGLEVIFEKNLIHRDIKPSNLAITREGVLKILDLGLAKLKTDADNSTQTGAVFGTLDYMSPEQTKDSKTVDIRTDIYSLGCTLYHLLTGSAPFEHHTSALVKLHAIWEEGFPELPADREDITEELRTVLRKMTARNPEDRFQTPVEVVVAMEALTDKDLTSIPWEEIEQQQQSLGQSSSKSLHSPSIETCRLQTRKENADNHRKLIWFLSGAGSLVALMILFAMAPLFNNAKEEGTNPESPQPKKLPVADVVPTPSEIPKGTIHPICFPSDQESHYRILDTKDGVHVISNHRSLLAVGDYQTGQQEIHVQIHQSQWKKGGLGLFLGYHPATRFGGLGQFQTLSLDRKISGKFRLNRNWLGFNDGREERAAGYHSNSYQKDLEFDNQPVTLTLRFHGGWLEEILLNGELIKELSGPKKINPAQVAGMKFTDQGLWGFYVNDSSGIFTDVQVNEEAITFKPLKER